MPLSTINAIKNQFNFKVPPGPLPPPVSRSFLFEIIDSKTQKIKESFTLVMPPTHVSVSEKQRVTVTKTFGNVFVDDYGPDNPEIVIRGFSGTSHAFPTFQTKGVYVPNNVVLTTVQAFTAGQTASSGYTHQTAFYAFRDTIMRYKGIVDKTDPDYYKYILRVTDLYDEQVYDCVLLGFNVERTPERPLYYPYTINLFVYGMPCNAGNMTATPIPVGGNITDLLAAIDNAMSWFTKAFAYVQAVKNSVAIIQNTVSLMAAKFNTYMTMAKTMATSPLDLTKQCLDLIGTFSTTVDSAKTNYKMTKDAWANAKEMIHQTYRDNLALYTEAIYGGQTQKNESIDYAGGMSILTGAALATSAAISKDIGTQPATKKTNVQSYQYTGVKEYTVRTEDTLQSIALRELGDSSLWPYIASANKILDNTELQTLETIYIPLSSRVASVQKKKDSFILTEDPARNPYGVDIRVDSASGDIVMGDNNDVSVIGGLSNIQQAIDLRFSTPLGSMIKQTGFGIMAQVGEPGIDITIRYLRMNIAQAVMSDPRIKAVKNIGLDVSGDTITASMDVDVIDYDQSLPVEVTL